MKRRIKDERLKQLKNIVQRRLNEHENPERPCLVHGLWAPEIRDLLEEVRDLRLERETRMRCAVCGHEFNPGENAKITDAGGLVCYSPNHKCWLQARKMAA